MNFSGILASELLKTKRSAARRIAIISPLCLAVFSLVQGGYFSLNLFNWFYTIFLPITAALIGTCIAQIDMGKHGLRTLRCLPLSQNKIWCAKLIVAAAHMFLSCALLLIAVSVIPALLNVLGVAQIKPLSLMSVVFGIIVMFLTMLWQIPFSFILNKRLGMAFTALINLFGSIVGILVALKSYWMLCSWSWVNHSMVFAINVLPNGLPADSSVSIEGYDVILALVASVVLTLLFSAASTLLYARSEAR